MRNKLWSAGAALLAVVAMHACSKSDVTTPPTGNATNAAAAAQFNHMGDSVVAAGGSATDAAPFYGAAGVVGKSPNIATVAVIIDSTVVTMNAVAVALDVSGGAMIMCPVPPMSAGAAAPFVCPWGIPRVTRTLFAWSPAEPERIVTFVATSDSGSIGTPMPVATPGASAIAIPIPTHLELRESRHIWWGVSGTQTNAVKPNGTSCFPSPTATDAEPHPGVIPAGHCQLADFTFAFNGVVAAPPISLRDNASATGTHTVSVAAASLTGLYFTLLVP